MALLACRGGALHVRQRPFRLGHRHLRIPAQQFRPDRPFFRRFFTHSPSRNSCNAKAGPCAALPTPLACSLSCPLQRRMKSSNGGTPCSKGAMPAWNFWAARATCGTRKKDMLRRHVGSFVCARSLPSAGILGFKEIQPGQGAPVVAELPGNLLVWPCSHPCPPSENALYRPAWHRR